MTMPQKFCLSLIVGSCVLIAAAYASAFLPGDAPAWAAWVLMLGTVTVMMAAAGLGALRTGASVRAVGPALLLTWLIVVGCFAAALLLPATDVTEPRLLLGLPVRAAAVLYGIGLLPMLVLPVAYALTFDTVTLTPADWERVREAKRGAAQRAEVEVEA